MLPNHIFPFQFWNPFIYQITVQLSTVHFRSYAKHNIIAKKKNIKKKIWSFSCVRKAFSNHRKIHLGNVNTLPKLSLQITLFGSRAAARWSCMTNIDFTFSFFRLKSFLVLALPKKNREMHREKENMHFKKSQFTTATVEMMAHRHNTQLLLTERVN